MKLVATRKSEQNLATLDPWTIIHFAFGLGAGMLNFGFASSMTAAVIYELIEQAFQKEEIGKSVFAISGPETLSNVLVDIGVFGLGHYLGQRWNSR